MTTGANVMVGDLDSVVASPAVVGEHVGVKYQKQLSAS